MKKNDFILIISVVVYSAMFYKQLPGINYLIFSLVMIALLLIRNKSLIKDTFWYVSAAASIVSGVCVMLYGTWLAFSANIVSLSLLSALSVSRGSSVLLAGMYSLYSYVSSIGFMVVDFIERRNVKNKQIGGKFWIKLSIGVGIFAVIILFFFLYQQSNPLFKDLTRKINLDWISWPWVRFTLLGFIILYGFFYHRNFKALYKWDITIPSSLSKEKYDEKGNVFWGKKLNISLERRSGIILLALLNILLLIVNILDVIYLWITKTLPEGMTLAESLHQGTGTLIVSIVLAIIIVLFYFRGYMNFDAENKYLKWLSYSWILQNVFVLISTGYRNLIYISEYSLTYKRLGVYVWLALTIIGLIITFYKLYKNRNNLFLFKANGWSFFLVLVAFACFNWDQVITRFNIKYSKGLDKNYLVELRSPSNLPELLAMPVDESEFEKDNFEPEDNFYYGRNYYDKLFYRGNYVSKLHKRLYEFLEGRYDTDWRSWNLAAYNAEKEIYLLGEQGKIKKLLLRKQNIESLEPISNLKNIEYIDASENSLNNTIPLEKMDKLNFLDISRNDFYDLDSIAIQPNLKTLNLAYNNINNFSNLRNFKNLIELSIENNSGIIDILPLTQLNNLEKLNLASNEISNIEKLVVLKNLKSLDISSMKDQDVIKKLPVLEDLEEINLSNNDFKLNDINLVEKFKAFKNLKSIDISSNNLSNLYLLTNTKTPVANFFFSWMAQKDVEPVFLNLTELKASSNSIRNLDALQYYPKLKSLNLSDNSLNSIETLNQLKSLEFLDLSNTNISSYDELSNLAVLKSLNLSSNNIKDISALKLPSVEILDLSTNQIVNMDAIGKFSNLKELYISGNSVYDISFLLKLKKLETLDISNNPIGSYEALYNLKHLKLLKVSEISLDTYNKLKENLGGTKIIARQIYKRKY